MKKLLYILYALCALSVFILAQGPPPITFTEIDGSPKKTAPSRIRVSNGTLSCSGNTCTITIGGGSAGGSDTQVQFNNAGAFGGISGFTSDGTRVTFTQNPIFNGGSGFLNNLVYVGSTSAVSVDASFGFFVAGLGSTSGSDGPYFLARGNTFNANTDQRGNILFTAGAPSSPSGNQGAIRFFTGSGEVERLQISRLGHVIYATGIALASLGTPVDGSTIYCNDCNVNTDPCTGSGTGAIAYRLNGRWYCP